MKFSEKYTEILFKDVTKVAEKLVKEILGEISSIEIKVTDAASDLNNSLSFCSAVTKNFGKNPYLDDLEIIINMDLIPDVPYKFILERVAVDVAITLYGFIKRYDVTGQELHELVHPIISEISNI